MISDKALYWIAAVVVVFGFSHRQFCGHDDWTSSVKDQFASIKDRVYLQADRLLSRTEFPAPDGGARMVQSQVAYMVQSQVKRARAQKSLACMQATLARRRAGFALLEANRERLVAMEHIYRGTFNPMPNLVINLPKVNVPKS